MQLYWPTSYPRPNRVRYERRCFAEGKNITGRTNDSSMDIAWLWSSVGRLLFVICGCIGAGIRTWPIRGAASGRYRKILAQWINIQTAYGSSMSTDEQSIVFFCAA